MANEWELKAEIDTDAEGRGYAGMTDAQVATDLNTARIQYDVPSMSASEIFSHVDGAEYNALTGDTLDRVNGVLAANDVDPFGVAATIFVSAFGGGSATITALQAARRFNISKAESLFGRGYTVTEEAVVHARGLN